jgi:hypothetical protein
MSSRYTAQSFDEARRFIEHVKGAGHTAELKERRAGKFICETPWYGKHYQRFVSKFKAQEEVRRLSDRYMEQGNLLQ